MIHIALTITPSYVRFCSVTMMSAMRNNPIRALAFHILAKGLSEHDQQTLRELAAHYEDQVCFYNVEDKMLRGYTIRWEGKRLPMVVFYRCLLASILPTDVQRVLYIDCDTLILSDLSPLWNAPLDDHPLAAVADEPVEINPAHAQRLQYEVSDNYFNGGVILFNLDYWRKHNLEETCRDFYQKYPERIRYNDQDLLNGLFHKSRILLPARWNVQSNFYRRKKVNRYQDNQDFLQAMLHPGILHYSSRKPWQLYSTHPLGHLFFHYQALTPWADKRMPRGWIDRLRQAWHQLPYTVHLKPKKYITHEEWNRLLQEKG